MLVGTKEICQVDIIELVNKMIADKIEIKRKKLNLDSHKKLPT